MRLDLVDEALRFEIGDDALARDIAVEAAILRRAVLVHLGFGREQVDQPAVELLLEIVLLAMALPDLEVVEVVCRGDLHRARALLRIGIFVGDYRDQAFGERQPHQLADEVPVAFIVGMHRDRAVAQHRLGARRGDAEILCGIVGKRIAEVPHVALHLDLLHLEVGNRGEQRRVPVDQPLVLVDQPLAVELHEHLQHRARKALVHGEAFA
jgi:hypothetical protein